MFLTSQHAGPNIAPVFPVHASMGITAASNVALLPRKVASAESSTFRR